MSLITRLPFLIPRVITWAEEVANQVAISGVALTATQIADAKIVGVQQPERIRLLIVDTIPLPEEAELHAAAQQIGFLSDNISGLTLGYAILIRSGYLNRTLLSHECRHVAQCEQAGSMDIFLSIYLTTVVLMGYENCPFEQDAWMHELS
ncbi:hypothetical protein BegalDRAFT_0419 [Beggiatoa alba B18LD]|uniref:DUF4157 domain-containing protein n=1 Tax=Beggiatoa alba B18LD TaxID=395493 RepID=I3CCJ5_9GAMM|nr:hypothetical protein [Beggiatoa alba]EIJ41338.1 hypothetical protein BegalDRAFT_0419 [Beggiatoa alba B18LD]